MSVNLSSLMKRLSPTCRKALEAAAGQCLSMTHYEVEVEHWLGKLLEDENSDASFILRAMDVTPDHVARELVRILDRFKTGNARNPTLSPFLIQCLEKAWLLGTLNFDEAEVRSGHLLIALCSSGSLSRRLLEGAPSLKAIRVEVLTEQFYQYVRGSNERRRPLDVAPTESTEVGATGEERDPNTSGGNVPTPALDKYTTNLTAAAREGEIDPIIGRDDEIRQMIDILMRRRQNNPILTGEAGVGKTAVVEGLAVRIAAGNIPPPLQEVALRTLDLALLQAGAGVKGEFENRLKSVIEEVKSSPIPIVLFIDEAHTLIGAGGAAGQGDAANLLKPALARGELRTVAATTWAEYKKYFEGDAALTRRFQVVQVDEPDEVRCIEMMRPVAQWLETHHKVLIRTEGIEEAVHLSKRYLHSRKLPDKAVSVLDTACARVALSQTAPPAAMDACNRKLLTLTMEADRLSREDLLGIDREARLAEIEVERESMEEKKTQITAQWEDEKALVAQLSTIYSRLMAHQNPSAEREESEKLELDAALFGRKGDGEEDPVWTQRVALREEQRQLEKRLAERQGDTPLISPWVDGSVVASVISAWSGIPLGSMVQDELETIRELRDRLGERILGQEPALLTISETIQGGKVGMRDPSKPAGVFLLVGPSGVGKTETALALADVMFGGDRNLVTLNMSEFQEKHSVSTLTGSRPGYVGYGEGGVLTEAVRRRPYSVVLLDEVEKAHPDVLKVFLNVFDKGFLDDGAGLRVDFRNTVILLTSNLGDQAILQYCAQRGEDLNHEELHALVAEVLRAHFRPEFLGRVRVIPYHPLDDDRLKPIIDLKLKRVADQLWENQRIRLTWEDEVLETIVGRCVEVQTGARNVDSILSNTVIPDISRRLLTRYGDGDPVTSIHIARSDSGDFQYEVCE